MSKYEEIRDFLKMEALKPASRQAMPTVRELMRKFDASQSPVMRAVRELKEAGVIDCRPGCGIVSTGMVKTYELQNELDAGKKGKIFFLSVDYFSENIWKMEHRLQSYCLQQDYSLMLYKLQRDTNLHALLTELLRRYEFKGVILLTAANRIPQPVFDVLAAAGMPTVLLDSAFHYENLPSHIAVLRPDAEDMGRKCARYLKDKGHSRIAYLRNEPLVDETDLRKIGFVQAAKELGMECFAFSGAIKSWENSMDAAVKISSEALPVIQRERISAILYASIAGAFAGKRVWQDAGMEIPRDIALLGGGDIQIAPYAMPSISAVDCDYEHMAQGAVDLIAGIVPWQTMIQYPYQIIERESSK